MEPEDIENCDEEELYKIYRFAYLDEDMEENNLETLSAKDSKTKATAIETVTESDTNLPIKFVDFENYVREKCENKIKILDRRTFHQIERPIILAFNHFRELCYYHTDKLDRLYRLALDYGEQIEIVVADLYDIDVLYPNSNPIAYFCCFTHPKEEWLKVFAIDKMKQIYEVENTPNLGLDMLRELCQDLLSGKLYRSQEPWKKQNPGSLVQICVHSQFQKMVMESRKDVLLIVDTGDYAGNFENYLEYEANFELLAQDFHSSNVEFIYMDALQNYVDFKYQAFCYPCVIFIPHNDKENFLRCPQAARSTESVREFIKQNIAAGGDVWRKRELEKLSYKPFTLPKDVEMSKDNLGQYLKENYPKSQITIYEPSDLILSNYCVIIYFMNFEKYGLHFFQDIIEKIHKVSTALTERKILFYIAELQQIKDIYPKWYGKYLDPLKLKETPLQVYAKDRLNFSYILEDFKSPAELFYYAFDLLETKCFFSQHWSVVEQDHLVKGCVAYDIKSLIENSKSNIFLTIYWGKTKESLRILNLLNEIAMEVNSSMHVELVKIDAKHNAIPLQYSYATYPVHFFIPTDNREEATVRYVNTESCSEDLLAFIKANVKGV